MPLEMYFWHVAFICAARDPGKCFMFDMNSQSFQILNNMNEGLSTSSQRALQFVPYNDGIVWCGVMGRLQTVFEIL